MSEKDFEHLRRRILKEFSPNSDKPISWIALQEKFLMKNDRENGLDNTTLLKVINRLQDEKLIFGIKHLFYRQTGPTIPFQLPS